MKATLLCICVLVLSLSGCSLFKSSSASTSVEAASAKDCAPTSPTDMSCPSQDYLDLIARSQKIQNDMKEKLNSDEVKKINDQLKEQQITWQGIQVSLNAMAPRDPIGRPYGYNDQTHRFVPPPQLTVAPPAPPKK